MDFAVLDNTVLVDLWVGDEKNSRQAQAVMALDLRWAVPSLWLYEFGNVMCKLVRLGLLSEELKQLAFRKAAELFEMVVDVDLIGVNTVVLESGLKFYDASYVWLAREKGCLLYTRDEQVLRACPDVAVAMPKI